jgi:hypothetical protein
MSVSRFASSTVTSFELDRQGSSDLRLGVWRKDSVWVKEW